MIFRTTLSWRGVDSDINSDDIAPDSDDVDFGGPRRTMKRILVASVTSHFSANQLLRWLLIAAATAVLCSCRSLEMPAPTSGPRSLSAPQADPPIPTYGILQEKPKRTTRFVTDQGVSPAKAPIVAGPDVTRRRGSGIVWMNDTAAQPPVKPASSVETTMRSAAANPVTYSGPESTACSTPEGGLGCNETPFGLPCPAPSASQPYDEYLCDGGDQKRLGEFDARPPDSRFGFGRYRDAFRDPR